MRLVELVWNDGVLDQQFEWDNFKSVLMRRFEDDGAGRSRLLHLEPASSADAPAIPRLEAAEAILRHRRRKIVAQRFAGSQKAFVYDAADGVYSKIGRAGVAAAVAEEAGHGAA